MKPNAPLPLPAATSLPGGATPPSDTASAGPGAPFSFPLIGDEVQFRRSPSHHPETGYVTGREFLTLCIDVVDVNAKPLRLTPGQYELVSA